MKIGPHTQSYYKRLHSFFLWHTSHNISAAAFATAALIDFTIIIIIIIISYQALLNTVNMLKQQS